MPDPQTSESRSFPAWKSWGAAAVGLLVLVGVMATVDVRRGWEWVDSLGAWAPVAFCLLYAGATAGMLPGSLLTLAAGAKWGPVEGLVYAIIASNLGANTAFGIGRIAAREWVSRLVERRPAFAAVEKAVAEEGWKIVLLLRLSPVFPFNVLNYALSLTSIRWRAYAPATLLGMLPGTALFVSIGSAVEAVARPRERGLADWIVLGAGLAATVVVTVLVTRTARRALAARLPDASDGAPRNPSPLPSASDTEPS